MIHQSPERVSLIFRLGVEVQELICDCSQMGAEVLPDNSGLTQDAGRAAVGGRNMESQF